LLQQIKLDWNSIEDNNEIRILEKYANENRLLSLILSFVVAIAIFFIIIIELIPVVLDAVTPMNKSRPRKVKIDFEFFIDEEQYFYIYLIYEIITLIIEVFTVLATGTLSYAFIRHCCATFKIARFSSFFMNVMNKWYFTLVIICVMSLSCNLFRVKYLLKQIKLDWNSIKDDSEIRILQKYENENRFLSLISSFVVAIAIFFIIIIELIPVVLDVVTPMNKSRPRKVKIDFEFFIDEEQYFYIYLIYEIITLIIETFTILATTTLSFTLIRHCCATFKIARYVYILILLKKVIYVELFVVYIKIVCSNLIEETVTQHTLQIPVYQKTHVMCHIISMFVFNFLGQSVSDHSAEIFNAAYNTMWYLAPISMQKLLLFVMQNSLKAYTLTVGHIYVTSLEGFSTVI
ncbi:hypothetical protein ALC56_12691, partial [Trachymyrmex septentrionalis]